MPFPALLRLAPLLALLLVAGCETVGRTLGFSTEAQLVDPGPGCPRVGVLPGAQRLVGWREGRGRDLTDVAFEVEIAGLAGFCEPDRRGETVTVELNPRFTVARGPANQDRGASFAYLVAVVDAEGRVLARETFQMQGAFPPNIVRATIADELRQRIPLRGKPGGAYQVLVGLEVDRDQLERNRRGQR